VRADEAVVDGAERLAAAGVDTPRVDAEWLVAHAIGLSRSELSASRDRELGEDEAALVEGLLARRERREPLAYVLGEWGFRRLTLKVDARVLVPRPETEIVVGRCLELLRGIEAPAVLDVGTGSGAIALAIADEHAGARVTAIDVSPGALDVARANAAGTGLDVVFELRDLRNGFAGSYDLIVSNPPYVTAAELTGLESEVRDWEPRLATVGDEHTAVIAAGAATVLVRGGWLVLEVADGRGEEVVALLRRTGYEDVVASPDLAGRDRVVEGRWTQ
jgi:release factor glutamine methyltransferase